MKKTRMFAALAASAMLLSALPVPAGAEQTYKTGDVNMDGEVSVEDAMLALKEYTFYNVAQMEHQITDEQIRLADVTDDTLFSTQGQRRGTVTAVDAQTILMYYTECVADSMLKERDIFDWAKERFPYLYSLPARDPGFEAGDVDMDGEVTITDAQILLQEYETVVVNGGKSILTPQQMALGDIYPNTAEDDPDTVLRRLGVKLKNFPVERIATDYPISLQDSYILLAYVTEMTCDGWGRKLDLFTADDYARYLCIPPEEERRQFMSKPLFQPGEPYSDDSVTVPDFCTFPLEQEDWSMQYAKVTKPGDFFFWYDGKDECEGCKILVYGTNQYTNQSTENKKIAALEQGTWNDEMKKISYGNTAIYYTLNINPDKDSENWREELKVGGRAALQWKSGAYWITVYTQEQYSEEQLLPFATCFTEMTAK